MNLLILLCLPEFVALVFMGALITNETLKKG